MYITTAIEKIRSIKERKKIIQSGTSCGKTYGILIILIDYCIRNPLTIVSVVSETMPHLRRGALRDFLNIMNKTGRFVDDRYNKSNLTYTFGNGSFIEFFSADSPDKLKGARRDILFINECNNVSYEVYQQLMIRTKGDIYLDYNPDRLFWAITDVAHEPDARLIKLNYKDNEALDPAIINEFKIKLDKANTSEYWRNWCRVYIDGEVGSLEGTVYTNWELIGSVPDDARLLGLGLDFGYTNDPTAVVSVYFYNGDLVVDELIYQAGLTNPGIANILKLMIPIGTEVWCDSAEPKSIAELKQLGIRAFGVVKGPDSVKWGISIVQQYKLWITERSKNLINELENYLWMKKDGTSTNIPMGSEDHALSGLRYLVMSKLGKRQPHQSPFKIGSFSNG